jgi:hypothetical protein
MQDGATALYIRLGGSEVVPFISFGLEPEMVEA